MLYVPDEFATVVNGPLVLPSGPTSVSLTVAPGVALPTRLTCVTPTIALLGLIAPVKLTVVGFTVTHTAGAARVNAPFFPSRMMLLYVPAVVLATVWIVN